MKRKLSALLAIVLVAVMVFPTAIFVGAADAPAYTVKLDGKEISSPYSLALAVDQKAVVTVETDAEVTYTNSENNFAAKIVATNSNKTYDFTGMLNGESGTLTIKIGDANFVVNVSCHTPVVDTESITVTTINGSEYKGSYVEYDARTEISSATVTAKLDNGKDVTASTVKFALSDSDTPAEKVTLTPDNKQLYIHYTFSGDGYTTYSNNKCIPIYVSGNKVTNLKVEPKSTTPCVDSISVDDFKKTYVSLVADGDIIGNNNYTLTVTNKNTQKTHTGDITKDNYTALVFNVDYNGYSLAANANVSEFISFKTIKPVSLSVDLANAKVTDYVEGQEITDFTGISVTVLYDDNSTKVISGKDLKNSGVSFPKFTYGVEKITVSYTEGSTTIKNDSVTILGYINVTKKQVVAIAKSSASTMKTSYSEGDKLELDGLKLTLTYNNGETKDVPYNDSQITCNPKNGAELNSTLKTVLVTYADPNTGYEKSTEISITVTANTKTTIKEVKLLSSSNAKKDYFIGEAFEPKGFEFLVVYSDATTDVKDLGSYTVTVDSSKYDSTKKQFTASMDGDLKVKFNMSHNGKTYEINLTLPGIKVTKRPLLTGIVATTNKIVFMEGDAPRVCDFKITAKYDDNTQRVFEVDAETTGATKSTYTVTKDNVYYTVKLTPTMIDSDTESIRVTYSEKTNEYGTKTFSDDIEIEVTVPDAILTYYDNTTGVKAYVSKAYEDFYEALKDAEDIADEYGSTYTSSYYSRVPEIQLRRDVIMSYDFDTTEDLKIDLNGHTLTMIRGELSVSTKAPNDTQVIFTNTADTDAKLIYSTSDDDTIIIAEDESFNIDRSSGSNKGKYDVTISSVKNGKVDGPREVTHGHDAKFTITPDEDYKIKSISVKQDKSTKKYTEKDGVVTVEDVQGALTITVTFEEKAWDNPFTDVYKSATYYKSIQFVYENGLFSGMSATKFEPDTTMTRAMFVTVLGRLAGVDTSKYTKAPNFTDVSTSDQSISYAIPYIQWATEKGLIEGYGNGKFGPKDNITHIQMYVLMQRYASAIELKNTGATSTSIPANDVSDIPTWAGAYEAVQYAAKYDFLVTSSNRITPNGDAKRSELAMLLEKFCDKVLDWEK